MQVFLSVLTRPLKRCDNIVMHVFTVSADQPLDWFKQHADELASKCLPQTPYVALNVEPAS